MCGIFGYIGPQQALPILVEGLRRLEYRGYDSTGVSVHDGTTIQTHKTVGKAADLHAILPAGIQGTLGIAHTRWATHGGVTDLNAHPHASRDGRIHLVHNGIIENFQLLRRRLTAQGIDCVSETDSEVLSFTWWRLRWRKVLRRLKRFNACSSTCEGPGGLCIMFNDHELLVCARNGSPSSSAKGTVKCLFQATPIHSPPTPSAWSTSKTADVAVITGRG